MNYKENKGPLCIDQRLRRGIRVQLNSPWAIFSAVWDGMFLPCSPSQLYPHRDRGYLSLSLLLSGRWWLCLKRGGTGPALSSTLRGANLSSASSLTVPISWGMSSEDMVKQERRLSHRKRDIQGRLGSRRGFWKGCSARMNNHIV